MVWPSGLLAIHGGTAYEFRMADGLKPSDCTTKASAQYRLSAVRSPSGEVMTFTYGCNGVDFEASWEGETVRVALDGMVAASAVPALDCGLQPGVSAAAFRDVEARLRVTYEGPKAIPGYTVMVLTGPENLTAEGRLVQNRFRQAMQLARIREDGSGETMAFGYGNARAVSFAGPSGTRNFAPTVLQEIVRPGRTIRLEWEGQPWPPPTEIGGGDAPWAAWSFGVAELHDRDLHGGAAGGEDLRYRRSAPQLGNGVRQSRHFASEGNAQGATPCRTYVRDRWALGAACNSATDPATQDLQRRLPYEDEGDIPTFVLDPQLRTLVPVTGQLTRWLNWKDASPANLDRPPDMHGFTPQGRSRIGLLGGGNEPTAKSGEKTMGPITYNPATGEVTMEASMGSVPDPPPRLGLPPAGYTGPIPIPSGSGAILAQQTAQLQQSLRESGARMAADAALRHQDLAMAAAQAEQAQQARLQDTMNWHMQAAQQRGRAQMAMQQMMAGQLALNAQANQALQVQLAAQSQQAAQRVQAIRMQLAAEKEQAGQREQNIQSQLAAVRMKLASVRAQSNLNQIRTSIKNSMATIKAFAQCTSNQLRGLGRITDAEIPSAIAALEKTDPIKAAFVKMQIDAVKHTNFGVGGGVFPVGGAVSLGGLGNIVQNGVVSESMALNAGTKWVGEGAKELGPGVYRSIDGSRQLRITTADLIGSHGKLGPHVHFESLSPAGKVMENLHVPIVPD
jgi:hypothetical protein